MKSIATLRYFAESNQAISAESLEDLGFEEVLVDNWKLQEPLKECKDNHSRPYMSTIYVRFDEDGIAMIEANNIYGSVKVGNYYIYQSATFKDLLNVVELLKI